MAQFGEWRMMNAQIRLPPSGKMLEQPYPSLGGVDEDKMLERVDGLLVVLTHASKIGQR